MSPFLSPESALKCIVLSNVKSEIAVLWSYVHPSILLCTLDPEIGSAMTMNLLVLFHSHCPRSQLGFGCPQA
eukprot:12253475-Ditylum_brightwellii.AAC.1